MKIMRLEIDNIGGVEAFELDAQGKHIVIGGKNRAGKSTVLRSIASAIGGAKERGAEPLRRGAKEGSVVVDLGDLVVKWRVTEKGKNAIVVETKEGLVLKSPQAKLRQLFGERTFDPLEFFKMAPAAQAQTIANLFGVDFEAFANARKKVYAERTTMNRLAKEYSAQADGIDVPDGTPGEPVDIAEISDTLRHEEKKNTQLESWKEKIKNIEVEISRQSDVVSCAISDREKAVTKARRDADEDIETAARQVDEAQKRLDVVTARKEGRIALADEQGEKAISEAQVRLDELKDRVEAGNEAIDSLDARCIDIGPIEERLHNAESINRAVTARKRREELEAQARDTKKEASALTDKIAEIDAEKVEAITAANIPVEGLSIEDGAVTFHGSQLSSLSSSEQLRISVALGVATHPEIAVMLIDKWGDLDEEGREIVRELADEAGVQIWTTVVGTKDEDISVVIRDGRIDL